MYTDITTEQLLTSARAQKAMGLFSEGYNCAQASLLAFSDILPIDEAAANSLAASFGGGMGKLGEVCGALTGVFAAAGLLYGPTSLVDKETKEGHYALILELGEAFKARTCCDSYLCKDLLEREIPAALTHSVDALKLTYVADAERPCVELVGLAVGMLDVYIQAHPLD